MACCLIRNISSMSRLQYQAGASRFFFSFLIILTGLDSKVFSETFKYPVFPSFSEWQFPHNNLPSLWSHETYASTNLSDSALNDVSKAVTFQNASCRISDHQEGREKAHLCPRSETFWLINNVMQYYNKRPKKDWLRRY